MASSTLRDYGYDFNEAGVLVEIDKKTNELTSKPFEFNVHKEHSKNQKRYEAIGETINDYVYQLLTEKANLIKLSVPKDSSSGTFIFASPDIFENEEKLLVLVHGSGVVRAGQWARSLIINDCLTSGTQLPFIERAKQEGYAILVLNTNDNYASVNGKKVLIKGSESPEHHFDYVWRNYILSDVKAKKVAIIAHSYGGVVTNYLVENNYDTFKDRVFAVAMTDSVHDFKRDKISTETAELLSQLSCNWVTSDRPLDTPLSSNAESIPRVSAGHTKHEMTSWSSFESIFKFLSSKLATSMKEEL